MAVEKLKKLQREKELLLERIEQLEAGKQMNVGEGDVESVNLFYNVNCGCFISNHNSIL